MGFISEVNINTGTYYEVLPTANLCNIVFQYKLVAGADNTIELQFWGTAYTDADDKNDDDWINVTEFFTELEEVIADNETIHDMSLIDTNCTFAKIKIKYIIVTSSPDNIVKVGWNSDK